MTWQKVASESDLSDGEAKQILLAGKKIALVRGYNGSFYAVDDTCTHEEESLSEGFVDDGTIECPRHGAVFDLKTGEAKSLPATHGLSVYAVKIDDNDIYIDL